MSDACGPLSAPRDPTEFERPHRLLVRTSCDTEGLGPRAVAAATEGSRMDVGGTVGVSVVRNR